MGARGGGELTIAIKKLQFVMGAVVGFFIALFLHQKRGEKEFDPQLQADSMCPQLAAPLESWRFCVEASEILPI